MNLYEGATITTLLLGVIEVAFWVWLVRGVILPLRTINNKRDRNGEEYG